MGVVVAVVTKVYWVLLCSYSRLGLVLQKFRSGPHRFIFEQCWGRIFYFWTINAFLTRSQQQANQECLCSNVCMHTNADKWTTQKHNANSTTWRMGGGTITNVLSTIILILATNDYHQSDEVVQNEDKEAALQHPTSTYETSSLTTSSA